MTDGTSADASKTDPPFLAGSPPISDAELVARLEEFNFDQLRVLCADLSVDYENIPGDGRTKAVKIREIIKYFDNRLQGDKLRAMVMTTPACPYPGMRSFSYTDPDMRRYLGYFFGRSQETQDLLGLIRTYGCVLVIGPSGSGKSSLVNASLVRQIMDKGELADLGPWLLRSIRPASDPIEALRTAFGLDSTGADTPILANGINPAISPQPQPRQAAGQGIDWEAALDTLLHANQPANCLLLVVDQLEELFTQADPTARAAFSYAVEELVNLFRQTSPRCVLIMIMRADFYASLMNSELWPLVDLGRVPRQEITTLRGHDLREAIQRPAEAVGVRVDADLLERLLADSDATKAPGVLPLLQETLVQIWPKMVGRRLSQVAYEAMGKDGKSGLEVAIARKADKTLADLSEEQRAIARRIFVRLVQFGEGRPNTRRQQPIAHLRSHNDDPVVFDVTLATLVENRLLVMSGDAQIQGSTPSSTSHPDDHRRVDIVHEALLRNWPQLGEWLRSRQAAEQIRRRLESQGQEWRARQDRGEGGGLLDEVELAEAQRWLDDPAAADLGVPPDLLALMDTSYAAIKQLEAERELAHQRELQHANALAREQEQRTRQLRTGLTIMVLIALVAALAAMAAVYGFAQATMARVTAVNEANARATEVIVRATAEANAVAAQAVAEQLARNALSRQLAAQAEVVRNQNVDFLPRSVLLAIEALRRSPSLEASESLRESTALLREPVLTFTKDRRIRNVLFSADGRQLLTSGSTDAESGFWAVLDIPSGREVVEATLKHEVLEMVVSTDGRYIATVAGTSQLSTVDDFVQVWNTNSGKELFELKHKDRVNSVAFSNDGKYLATASADGTAVVWDINSGSAIAHLPHSKGANHAVFSPDGRYLATASGDGTAHVWEIPNGREISWMKQSGGIYTMTFSPDGRYVVTGGFDLNAHVWEAMTGREALHLTHDEGVSRATFSPDGRLLATASWDRTARIWDATSGRELAQLTHDEDVGDVTFSPNGRYIVTRSIIRNSARVWDTAARQEVARIVAEDIVDSMAFSPDGRYLAVGTPRGGTLWRFADNPVMLRIPHESPVYSVTFSRDGKYFATGTATGNVNVWDARTGEALMTVTQDGEVDSVAFSADGKHLASSGWSQFAHLWDIETGREIAQMKHKEDFTVVHEVAFSPDGKYLATISANQSAWLWDASTGHLLIQITDGSDMSALDFSPDSARLVTVSAHGNLQVWDVSSGKEIKQIFPRAGAVDVRFSPDGSYLATAGGDATVSLWSMTTGDEVVRMYDKHDISGIRFSPDGRYIAAMGWNRAVKLWEVPSGQPVAEVGKDWAVFSPDGKYLASYGYDETVHVWETVGGREVSRLTNPDEVRGLSFSPDGNYLLAGGRDRIAKLWLWRTEDLVALACARLSRNLAPWEWSLYLSTEPYEKTCPNLP